MLQVCNSSQKRFVRFVLPESEKPEELETVLPVWLKEMLAQAYEQDLVPSEILEALDKGKDRHPLISLAECTRQNGLLYYRNRLYVPDNNDLKAELLKESHESLIAGHQGKTKTYELLSRSYYWPGMLQYVKRWVRNCHTCKRTTPFCDGHQGLLRSLTAPEKPWKDISVDFITHLPKSQGYDAIMVVVDRLTKFRHYIPCTGSCDAKGAARLFRDHIWRFHGLPETVVSD